jgi:hypothetical protein
MKLAFYYILLIFVPDLKGFLLSPSIKQDERDNEMISSLQKSFFLLILPLFLLQLFFTLFNIFENSLNVSLSKTSILDYCITFCFAFPTLINLSDSYCGIPQMVERHILKIFYSIGMISILLK